MPRRVRPAKRGVLVSLVLGVPALSGCSLIGDSSSDGCGFTATDLERWFPYAGTELTDLRGDGLCVFEESDGTRMTVRIGAPEQFDDRLAGLAAVPGDDYMSRFDPNGDHDYMEAQREDRIVAVGAAHGEVIIVDVEPVTTWRTVPGSLTRFALERRNPHDLDSTTAAFPSLVPDDVQCHQFFAAYNPAATVGVVIPLTGVQPGPTTPRSGTARIPADAGASIVVGQRLGAGRCTDIAPLEPAEITAVWPVIAGTVDWSWEPNPPVQCGVTATAEMRGLVVERPDGATLPIPDLTIVNGAFGDPFTNGCAP